MIIKVATKNCPRCGGQSILSLEEQAFKDWREGMLIQDAFPDMDEERRELLMTGTHPECWEILFGDSE